MHSPTFSIATVGSIGRTGSGSAAAASIDRIGNAVEEALIGHTCSVLASV